MFLRVISSFLFFFAENIREVNLIIEKVTRHQRSLCIKMGI